MFLRSLSSFLTTPAFVDTNVKYIIALKLNE